MYKNIFWDLDHTLWDFESNSVLALELMYNEFKLNQLGAAPFAAFEVNYHKHNTKYWDRFRKGFITRAQMRWKRMYVTLSDYKIFDEKLALALGDSYLEYLGQQKKVFTGAHDVLEYCKQKGYKQHIITNGFEKTQIQKMQNSGIYQYFDVLVASETAMALKPHKEIYEFAMQQVNATPKECIMIGDDNNVDIAGAHNVGMDSIWFNNLLKKDTTKANHVVSSLEQIKSIL